MTLPANVAGRVIQSHPRSHRGRRRRNQEAGVAYLILNVALRTSESGLTNHGVASPKTLKHRPCQRTQVDLPHSPVNQNGYRAEVPSKERLFEKNGSIFFSTRSAIWFT